MPVRIASSSRRPVTSQPTARPPRRPTLAERVAEAALRVRAPWRGAVGRWAVRKGLYAHALAVAPEDPYVIAKAGFFEQAAEQAKPGEAAWLAAMAGLGRLDLLAETADSAGPLTAADRRWIAGLAAAWKPEAGLDLLEPSMAVERAACFLALDQPDAAEALLEPAVRSPERSLLLAAAAAQTGDWTEARVRINAAFAARALNVPLREPRETPITLAEFDPDRGPGRSSGPLVSIVLPARNAAATLPTALKSLLRQNWEALEVIVVDDGSTDGGGTAVEAAAKADSRVRVVVNSGPPGPSGARNTGVAAAAGDYIGFHDADDWAHPGRLQRQVEAIEAGRGVAAVSRHFRLAADGRPLAPRVLPMVRLAPISLLARAEAVRAAGPWEDSPVGADSEFLARMDLLYGRRNVVRLDQIHLVAGWAAGSISGAKPTGLTSPEGRAAREAYERDWRTRHAQRVRDGLA